jgi:hypothetical protein
MFKVKFTKIFLKDLKNVQEIKPHRMYLQSKNPTIKNTRLTNLVKFKLLSTIYQFDKTKGPRMV